MLMMARAIACLEIIEMLKLFTLTDMYNIALVCKNTYAIVERRLRKYRRLFIKYAPKFLARFLRQIHSDAPLYKQHLGVMRYNTIGVLEVSINNVFTVIFDFILFARVAKTAQIAVTIFYMGTRFVLTRFIDIAEWNAIGDGFYLKLNLDSRFNPIPINADNAPSFSFIGVFELDITSIAVIYGNIIDPLPQQLNVHVGNIYNLLSRTIITT